MRRTSKPLAPGDDPYRYRGSIRDIYGKTPSIPNHYLYPTEWHWAHHHFGLRIYMSSRWEFGIVALADGRFLVDGKVKEIGLGLKRKAIEKAWAGSPVGYVYFISRGAMYTKIGYSLKPEERLKQLRIATPERLKMEVFVPGTMREEKLLHLKFRRVRTQGEWFYNSSDLSALVARLRANPSTLIAEAEAPT